jgi:hypothetical protein
VPDSKYGRLFTEADVERIIAEALIQQHKQPQVRAANVIAEVQHQTGEFTFPADEPLFLLRGQDALAPGVVMSYAMACADAHASEEHRDGAWRTHDALVDWQAEHPDRVKVPS